jgi:hypothetical protein
MTKILEVKTTEAVEKEWVNQWQSRSLCNSEISDWKISADAPFTCPCKYVLSNTTFSMYENTITLWWIGLVPLETVTIEHTKTGVEIKADVIGDELYFPYLPQYYYRLLEKIADREISLWWLNREEVS